MFQNDNIKDFGGYLKKLRLSLGFSQKDVQKLSGITADSLRRIENGDVLPRYDTIFYLSMVYKKDLLDDLRTYSNSQGLLEYYNRLELLIHSYDKEVLTNLESDFNAIMDNQREDLLLNPHIKEQFIKLLSGISKYNSEDTEQSLDYFIDAMKLTNPMFNIETYREFKYTVFELRILLLIALSLVSREQFILSNSILEYLLEKSNLDKRATTNEKLLIIKIYYNLSYNYHRLISNHKVLEYAQAGIDYCNANHLSYALAHLYYRKGIAEFLTNQPNYLESLEQSVCLLTVTNKKELAKIFAKITYESYDIVIPNAPK